MRALALAYDADTVVVGGGLSGLGQVLVDGMAEHFDTWAATSPLIASLDLGRITHLLEGDRPVPAIGAAIMGGRHG